MAHSKFIVIKCPACGEKFEAEREEESSFISCPDCNMQVKISGTHDGKRRSPRPMAPASSLPSKRYQQRVQFSDLAAGGSALDREAARKRVREREANEELIIDEEEETAADKPANAEQPSSGKEMPLRGIERRAAKLEERAAKLEERAAKLAKLQGEREAAAKAKSRTSSEASPKKTPKDMASSGSESREIPAAEAASSKDVSRPSTEDQEDLDFEKVEVRSSGQRRRLRRAPKAEVPKPRNRQASTSYVDDLRADKPKHAAAKTVRPKEAFDNRKITEGSQWRRHRPNRAGDPEWESEEIEEIEEKVHLQPAQRRRKIFLWAVFGLVAVFLIVVSYHFMLAQLGWIRPMASVEEDAVVAPRKESRTKAEMLERAAPVIEAFLNSNSNEEALQHVRRKGEVAGFMRKHYLQEGFQPVEFKSLGPVEKCEVVDEDFLRVSVNLKDYSAREIYVEIPRSESGDEWLVDWESWVGYSEMGFNEMLLRRPKDPVLVRCFMLQEVHYAAAFPDAEDHRSFRLLDHDRENQLWGYIDTSSDAYSTVASELVGATHHLVKATLRVRFPEESSPGGSNQVEITELVTFGWVLRQ